MVEPTKPYNPFEARFGKSSTFLMPLAVGSVLLAFALFLLVESEWRAGEVAEQRAVRAGIVEADASAPDPQDAASLVMVAGEVEPADEPPVGVADTLPPVLAYRVVVEEFDGADWLPVEEEEEDRWTAADAHIGDWVVPHRLWRRLPEVTLTEDAPGPEGDEALEPGVQRTRIVGIPAGEYTMVGEQTGDTLRPWSGLAEGDTIFEMEQGVLGPDDVLPPIDLGDVQLLWLQRGGAFLCIFMGLSMIFGGLGLAAGVSPGRWWAGMGGLTLGTTVAFAGISYMMGVGTGLGLLVLGVVLAGAGVVLLRAPAEKSDSPEETPGGEA